MDVRHVGRVIGQQDGQRVGGVGQESGVEHRAMSRRNGQGKDAGFDQILEEVRAIRWLRRASLAVEWHLHEHFGVEDVGVGHFGAHIDVGAAPAPRPDEDE